MINKEHRLRKNKHFRYIYKHGDSKQIGVISLVYIKTKFKPFKVGFSVSNKIGKSVVRNKVKRRMRESFNQLYNNVNPNYNYIFIARTQIINYTQQQIKDNMKTLLMRAKLYEENS